MAPLASDSPIQYVKGVGPTRAEWFATLGIRTVGQLLEYYPFRYEEDRGEVDIADVVPGSQVTVRGEVVRLRRRPPGFWCEIDDGTERCVLRWFNRPYAAKGLFLGATVVATGQAQVFGDHLELVQPRVQVFAPDAVLLTRKRGARWVGVYRGNATVKSPLIRRTVLNVLAEGPLPIEEVLPPALLAKHKFPTREQAVRDMHCPAGQADLDRARRRLAYEELLLMELAMALRRRKRLALQSGRKLAWTAEIDQRIRARFPFTLTAAQDKALREIVADLRSGRPMTRLLQGDVGSGKTVVALYACLVAIAGGKQAAIMAPTEILAHQHFAKIDQYLRGSRVRYVLLRGKMNAKERRDALAAIERGDIDLVVGTQALIQKDVAFSELALVIVDEQHKFGVVQRHTFRTKGPMPHYLVMTATPIPRTLAMTVFGDLDVSVIRQSPPGRGRIITKVVPLAKWDVVMTYVRKRLEAGEQAYVVCPQIGGERHGGTGKREQETRNGEPGTGDWEPAGTEEGWRDSGIRGLKAGGRGTGNGEQGTGNREVRSARRAADAAYPRSHVPASPRLQLPTPPRRDAAAVASVNEVHQRLTTGPWAGLNVGLLHGSLPQREKDAIVADFAAGRLHAVVATTVVEVGVDVPNATIMIVEHADRYGLSQLHQLRGRVGRGSKDSLCVLIAHGPGDKAAERLAVMARTTDGFKIAEADLAQRGPGQLFGTRQHGLPELNVASIVDDFALVERAREDAFALVAADPELRRPEHQPLIPALKRMFGEKLKLIDAA
mgnify:FL=1